MPRRTSTPMPKVLVQHLKLAIAALVATTIAGICGLDVIITGASDSAAINRIAAICVVLIAFVPAGSLIVWWCYADSEAQRQRQRAKMHTAAMGFVFGQPSRRRSPSTGPLASHLTAMQDGRRRPAAT